MYRIIDLSIRPHPAPVGNGEVLQRPPQTVQPTPSLLAEPLGKGRSIADVLGYYEFYHLMSGVQAGEIFTKGTLTTKPWTSSASYLNREYQANGRPQYLSDLTSDHLVGPYSLIDLGGQLKAGGTIGLDMLKAKAPAKFEKILVIRTGFSKNRPPRPDAAYYRDSPVLSREAAEWLAGLGIHTVAADIRTLDPRYALRSAENIHEILNRRGILVIEDLIGLEGLNARHDFLFIGIPLPIRGVTGGAARVFAVNMKQPSDFIDCTPALDSYPDNPYDYDVPFLPPVKKRALNEFGDYPNVLPGRIEPRELQGITQKTCRLTPFRIIDEQGRLVGEDMYIEYGHATGTHIEAAFYDPWGRHSVPEEVFKRYVRIPKDRLVSEACLLDLAAVVGPLQQIDSTHLKDADPGLKKGDIAVIRADIADWFFWGSVPGNTPGLSPDAAMWLVEKGIRGLLCDFAVERTDPISGNIAVKYTPNKVHYFLHKNDIPIIEWAVNLKLIRKKRFTISINALPASHQGGYPSHVFAVETW